MQFVLLAGSLVVCLLDFSGAAAQPKAKNVLVLSAGRGHWSIDQMEASLRAHVPLPVNFSDTDLESPNFDDESYRDSLAQELRNGFAIEKPDLVVAVMDASLKFAIEYRDQIFPGVPIVFMSVSSPRAKRMGWRWPGVTGVASPVGIRETIDLALRLHPDTNTIAVVTNVSSTEKEYFLAVHDELLHYRDKVKEIDIVGPPGTQLVERIKALPPHTVVLFQLWPEESKSISLGAYDVLAAITPRLPTYCIFPGLCLNHGGMGGAYDDPKKDAVLAGELGARVLSGERPEDVPIAQNSELQVEVDWRELQHWHISEAALPPGAAILYREPTLWERYKGFVIAAISVIVVQALLIAALLWQRARKRKAEGVVRESEERFRALANTTPAIIWMCDIRGNITYLNDRWTAFAGPEPNAGYGHIWTAYVHPDDLRDWLDTVTEALKLRKPFSAEYRLRRTDGVYRWMFDVASPRVNGEGTFVGFIGSAIDTTDQKIAQQALQRLSGQLIEAQEKERSRIARELHDDISQRLAVLSIELDQANRASNGPIEGLNLEELQKHCSEIAEDVQALSHQLHSSKLDYLGIAAALRGFCGEFSKQHGVRVEFRERNVPRRLPKDVSLSLFRVAQEALHNAAKYSETNEFVVELRADTNDIQLEVSDCGVGFDVEQAKRGRGLGLVSMQERVNLVHGKLFVESRRGAGTRILAVVPLADGKGPSPETVSEGAIRAEMG